MKKTLVKKHAVLIAGSTASGKSALAIKKAKESGALIINADSMQVYDILNVLSARPQPKDLMQAEHVLYGIIHPSIRFSTGEWFRAVREIIELEKENQRPLVFVGGTGLYFNALIDGFIKIPEVDKDVVTKLEAEIAPLSKEQRFRILQERDPKMAKILIEPDRQRLVRALSVLLSTGKSLAEWQREEQSGLLDEFNIERIVLNPEKEMLNKRIAKRFENMMSEGAIEEVKILLDLGLNKNLPAMKAIGVSQILAMLVGEISKGEAIELSVIATRQYAKRQRTWFRKRMKDWNWV
jgi:tRNA dimethylallyltransferase